MNLQQHAPKNLSRIQKTMILFLFRNQKAAKIMPLLCDKKGAYLNEIHRAVGGSKTNTVEILKALEKIRVIKSKWEIKKFKGEGVPSTRAIKTFQLSEDKEKLIEFYEPLFRMID